MNDAKQLNNLIQLSLSKVKGILNFCPVHPKEREKILELEQEAEKRSLMGLGKVINAGIREVLRFDMVYVALTTMEYNWGHCSALVLKKGDKIVGESIYDEALIAKLSQDPNVWFMHRNFVIYKDLVSFPKDIMQKICHFEIPGLPGDQLDITMEDDISTEIRYGIPSTYCDVHLKELYFEGKDEQGLGTLLIGVNTTTDNKKEKIND
jgi:hypothetical protein